MGFEPMSPFTQAKRLAGARTRPLCDPSPYIYMLTNGFNPSNTWLSGRSQKPTLKRFSTAVDIGQMPSQLHVELKYSE